MPQVINFCDLHFSTYMPNSLFQALETLYTNGYRDIFIESQAEDMEGIKKEIQGMISQLNGFTSDSKLTHDRAVALKKNLISIREVIDKAVELGAKIHTTGYPEHNHDIYNRSIWQFSVTNSLLNDISKLIVFQGAAHCKNIIDIIGIIELLGFPIIVASHIFINSDYQYTNAALLDNNFRPKSNDTKMVYCPEYDENCITDIINSISNTTANWDL